LLYEKFQTTLIKTKLQRYSARRFSDNAKILTAKALQESTWTTRGEMAPNKQ